MSAIMRRNGAMVCLSNVLALYSYSHSFHRQSLLHSCTPFLTNNNTYGLKVKRVLQSLSSKSCLDEVILKF